VDLWLNNPIRPNEASGTSGQKAALNGIPNASILDGWWPEGYNGKNGWAIGEERAYLNQDVQDEADSAALYDLMEKDIVPTYYDRDDKGFPHKWIAIMKESIRTCAPLFSTFRMLKDYTNLAYVPCMTGTNALAANNFQKGRELAVWKQFMFNNWHNVSVFADVPKEEKMAIGDTIEVKARVRLGMIRAEDVSVELLTAVTYDEKLSNLTVTPMTLEGATTDQQGFYHYTAHKVADVGGSVVLAVRVLPNHTTLFNKTALGLVRWA
jgi:glycogen phosphorylase